MRILTVLLAVVVAGLAFWWGGAPGPDEPLLLRDPEAAATESARGRPDALPGDPVATGEATSDRPAALAQGHREAVTAGTCRLLLRLVDAATGAPLDPGGGQEVEVQVWQLGLAADEDWTAGDRRVHEGPTVAGAVSLGDLTPGRYRAWVPGARRGSHLPEAFDLTPTVDGSAVVVDWPVAPVTREPMWLEVLDPAGLRPEALQRKHPRWRYHLRGGEDPPWAEPRRPKDLLETAFGISGGIGGRGAYRSSSGRSWLDLALEPAGFALGSYEQDARHLGRTYTLGLREPGGPQAVLDLQPRGANRFLVAWVVREDVLARLVVPVGTDPERAADVLTLRLHALPLGPDEDPLAALPRAEVTAELDLEGHAPLEVTWRPAFEPVPLLEVRRAP